MPTPRAAHHRDLEQILRDLKRGTRGTFSVVSAGGVSQPWDNRATALGGAVERVRLDFQPAPHSVHLYWNGVYQDDDQWALDGFNLLVDNAGGLIRTGDELVAKYVYNDPTPRPAAEPVSLSLVGYTTPASPPPGTVSGLALPPGTLPGDLLVLSLNAGAFYSPATVCTDDRITGQGFEDGFVSMYVGWGIADGSPDPITTLLHAGAGDLWGCLAAYRITGAVDEVSFSWAGFDSVPDGACFPTTPPAVAGSQAVMGLAATVAGDMPHDDLGNWTPDGSGGHSPATAGTWYTPGGIIAPYMKMGADDLAVWAAVVVRISPED